MNEPPSPFLQKPSASIQASAMKLNPSYTSMTSTSAGVRSVLVHSMADASRRAMVVRSSHWSHEFRPLIAHPIAWTRTGGLRRSGTVSADETIMAVEPSQGTSQSYRQNGVVIIRTDR